MALEPHEYKFRTKYVTKDGTVKYYDAKKYYYPKENPKKPGKGPSGDTVYAVNCAVKGLSRENLARVVQFIEELKNTGCVDLNTTT